MVVNRFGKNLKEACSHITLHGFINIAQSNSVVEMVFWITVQCLCFALCLWLMAIYWVRYQSRPTITTIKSTAYPISDIPFPAVTICNGNVVYKKNTNTYVEILKNKGVNETLIHNYFTNLKYLIYPGNSVEDFVEFAEIDKIFSDLDITVEKMMRNLSHPCKEMLSGCSWAGEAMNCADIFRNIKSGLGFCCSFNFHNHKLMDVNDDTIPFKELAVADGAGMTHGLGMAVNINSDQYMSSVFPFFGLFVLVHPNWDFADLSAFSVISQPNDFALMQLIPSVSTSDEALKSVSAEKRNCWFSYEGYLQSTENYSFINCVNECKAKTIYSLCKCIPYYYPGLGTREQCTLQHVSCLKKYEALYNSVKLSDKPVANGTACNCLPECEDILYDGYLNSVRGIFNASIASVKIYYDHAWCVEYIQSLNLTWDVLLASLGGIFGLCLGGSLISLVEIVFYILKSVIVTIAETNRVVPSKQFKKKNVHSQKTIIAHY